MIELRPYQQAGIAEIRQRMASGNRRVLYQLPCGGGKTVTVGWMIREAVARGKRCLFVAHRRELIRQSSETMAALGVDHGVIQAGVPPRPAAVQVASVQTIARRLDRYRPPDLLVIDEAHHAPAGQYRAVMDWAPAAYVVGLSATPERLDGRGLKEHFDSLVCGPSVGELIRLGALARFRCFAPPIPADWSGVRRRGGDYATDELEAAMDKPAITGCAVEHYQRLAAGKRCVVFAVSIKHSRHIVDQFLAAGIPAEHADGEMDHRERDAIIRRLRAGETKVVSNVDLISEGFDCPAIEAVSLLRPTESLALHIQQSGRALRPAPGKDAALILDHVGGTMRHGLPDAERTWELTATKRKKPKTPIEQGRRCRECFAVFAAWLSVCPECGAEVEKKPREVDQRAGDLEEVKSIPNPRALIRGARSLAELQAVGRQLGYKPGWAWHRWRTSKWRKQSAAS